MYCNDNFILCACVCLHMSTVSFILSPNQFSSILYSTKIIILSALRQHLHFKSVLFLYHWYTIIVFVYTSFEFDFIFIFSVSLWLKFRYDRVEVELFASEDGNNPLSPLIRPHISNFVGLDALVHAWARLRLYTFPPMALLPAVLAKVCQDWVCFILMVNGSNGFF